MSATWTDSPAAGRDFSLTRAEAGAAAAGALAAGAAAQGRSTGTAVTAGSAGRCHAGMIDDPGPAAIAAARAGGWQP